MLYVATDKYSKRKVKGEKCGRQHSKQANRNQYETK